jgi:hypothetical protein
MIYFLQAGTSEAPVKIGHCAGPVSVSTMRSRLKGLQTGSPFKLEVRAMIEGDRQVEEALHQKFAKARTHGEWFRPVASLLELMHANAVDPDAFKPKPRAAAVPARRLEIPNVPDVLFERLEAARGDVPRSRFVLRALEAYLSGAVKDDPSPALPSSVAGQAAAPVSSRPTWPDVQRDLVSIPGVARASSLVKRDVRPIPKGKK